MCLMKKSFYVFDCLSRDEKGMPVSVGTANVTKHSTSADVEILLTESANSLKTADFLKLTLFTISSHEEHFQSNETLLCEGSDSFPINETLSKHIPNCSENFKRSCGQQT
ncbi:hypothetical protein PoB_001679100 [Plakobranchus ocellatus]|uniref:Uncharacterized protein n=1 Tax=Plakobranchus ocellatus TaxID=259542 RepID=A0AAV3Z330_9GAST|nr:hypothetical protein PoB_001679100 [Plakobranchus ocellatus]